MSPEASEPRGDVRQTLIDAALTVVSEVGIAKTTIRRIAEAAGLPLGSLRFLGELLGDIPRIATAPAATAA